MFIIILYILKICLTISRTIESIQKRIKMTVKVLHQHRLYFISEPLSTSEYKKKRVPKLRFFVILLRINLEIWYGD